MGTVHHDLLNRQNDARGILVARRTKRDAPHKGRRRPNDTLVGVVRFSLVQCSGLVKNRMARVFLCLGKSDQQDEASVFL